MMPAHKVVIVNARDRDCHTFEFDNEGEAVAVIDTLEKLRNYGYFVGTLRRFRQGGWQQVGEDV